MKVLVLLSTYNGEHYLKDQLDSVLSQTGVDVSLLIRDDGSRDNTISILQSYKDHYSNIDIELGNNIGCSASFYWLLNEAKRKGVYDYYAFCDQDDVWLPQKLINACTSLSQINESSPKMYCSNLRVVNEKLEDIGMKWNSNEEFVTKEQSLVCSMATGCTVVFDRTALDFFHHYPPRKMVIHDLWMLHLCLFFGRVVYDKESYILYRQHGRNVIGAKTTLKSNILSKWHSLLHLFAHRGNELEAREMLFAYKDILAEEDRKLIEIVANYRNRLSIRLRFLLGIGQAGKIRRKSDNLWLLFRIILGVV